MQGDHRRVTTPRVIELVEYEPRDLSGGMLSAEQADLLRLQYGRFVTIERPWWQSEPAWHLFHRDTWAMCRWTMACTWRCNPRCH
jgi:hypothetical protein